MLAYCTVWNVSAGIHCSFYLIISQAVNCLILLSEQSVFTGILAHLPIATDAPLRGYCIVLHITTSIAKYKPIQHDHLATLAYSPGGSWLLPSVKMKPTLLTSG